MCRPQAVECVENLALCAGEIEPDLGVGVNGPAQFDGVVLQPVGGFEKFRSGSFEIHGVTLPQRCAASDCRLRFGTQQPAHNNRIRA